MNEKGPPGPSPEDIRSEYAAVVSYHSAIVGSRFTIAGLYVAAVGFVAAAVLRQEATWGIRLGASAIACWFTLCLWILELRGRALYTNLAHRGIEIEHRVWGLQGEHWYAGFFSRQYKEPPVDPDERKLVPARPGPDLPTLGWAKRPLPEGLSRHIRHSLGLDLLYAGGGLFWLVLLGLSILAVVTDS